MIKGISEKRRLPLLGKIRLGIKKQTAAGKEYPAEVDYFVCPDEVKSIYGAEPKELKVMFPVADREVIFNQFYRFYGSTKGLKCKGDGEQATKLSDDKKELVTIDCPCELLETKKCGKRAFLMAILPEVNVGGVYQISTGSYYSIVDINSGLDYVEALIGRIQMIPLILRRELTETHFDDKKQKHYTLKINFRGDINFANQLREDNKRILLESKQVLLPAPVDENPADDEVPAIPDGIKDEEDTPAPAPAPATKDTLKDPEPADMPQSAPKPAEAAKTGVGQPTDAELLAEMPLSVEQVEQLKQMRAIYKVRTAEDVKNFLLKNYSVGTINEIKQKYYQHFWSWLRNDKPKDGEMF